jgi:hypothetical protein
MNVVRVSSLSCLAYGCTDGEPEPFVKLILDAYSCETSPPMWNHDPLENTDIDYGSRRTYTCDNVKIDSYIRDPRFQEISSRSILLFFKKGYPGDDNSYGHSTRHYYLPLLEALTRIPSFREVPIDELEALLLVDLSLARVLMKTDRFQDFSAKCLERALIKWTERSRLELYYSVDEHLMRAIMVHPNFQNIAGDVWGTLRSAVNKGDCGEFSVALAQYLPQNLPPRVPSDFVACLFISVCRDYRYGNRAKAIQALLAHPEFLKFDPKVLSECIQKLLFLVDDPPLYADVKRALMQHPSYQSISGDDVGGIIMCLIGNDLQPQLKELLQDLLTHINFQNISPKVLLELLAKSNFKKNNLLIDRILQHRNFIQINKTKLCQFLRDVYEEKIIVAALPLLQGSDPVSFNSLVFNYAMYPRERAFRLLISYPWFPYQSVIEASERARKEGTQFPMVTRRALVEQFPPSCCTLL